ncbi:MAG: DsbA family protein [Actinomycetota bacterium]
MAKDKPSKSVREKAAAARAEQQAKEKRRERTVRIVGAIGVIVVVVASIGIAVFASRSGSGGGGDVRPLPSPDPSAPVPAGVYDSSGEVPYGVPYGTAPVTSPLLEIWEDFQCPACGSLEAVNGAGIQSLAEEGKVRLVWRPTAFLDNNLGNQSSAEAIAAWGCAIDAGKTAEYHDVIYANQPTVEGDGYTQEQLLAFAEEVGISGVPLEEFNTCLTGGRYLGWAVNSTQAFYEAEIPGTPAGFLNGTQLDGAQLADQAGLEKLVAEATQ